MNSKVDKIIRGIVKKIIRGVDKGNAFDSHFVIDTIIKENSDEYLKYVAEHLARSKVTEYAHSEIAKVIASFEGNLVQNLLLKSTSYNIHGKASACALWKRI